MAILFSDHETERYRKTPVCLIVVNGPKKTRDCKLNGLCLKGYGSDYRGAFNNICTCKIAFDAEDYLYKLFLNFKVLFDSNE